MSGNKMFNFTNPEGRLDYPNSQHDPLRIVNKKRVELNVFL